MKREWQNTYTRVAVDDPEADVTVEQTDSEVDAELELNDEINTVGIEG